MRRLIALCLLVLILGGCEVRTLYGIQLADYAEEGIWKTIQKREYTLYLSGANHPEVPGFYLIAQVNDRPNLSWDWEEFQTWSPERKASVYGSYYDQIYFDLSVSHQSTCPFHVKSFDHRDRAQETAYGRWLHDLPMKDRLDEPLKGLFVQVPIGDCKALLNPPADKVEALTVVVKDIIGEDQDQIEVKFRIEVVDTWIDSWFF